MASGSKGPSQTSTTNATTQPWAPTQGLLNSLIGTIGAQYGGGSPAGGAGGLFGAGSASLPAGKRDVFGGAGGGTPFNVGLTGAESGALDTMAANAGNAGRFAPDIGMLAGDLFRGGTDRTGMVTGNLDEYRAGLLPYATGSINPYDDPTFSAMLKNVGNDALDRVKSSYAGAGYSPASVGDFGQSVGKGVTEATLPIAVAQGNTLAARQRAAQDALYGAGTTATGLLANLDQTALGNRLQGINVGNAALSAENAPAMAALEVEARRRGIPLQNIAGLSSLIVPMAQLGGTSNSTTQSQTQVSPLQTILGAGMMGAGLLSGNPMAALGGLGSVTGGLMSGVPMNGASPMGAFSGNFFPGNAGAAGASAFNLPGVGMIPMFR